MSPRNNSPRLGFSAALFAGEEARELLFRNHLTDVDTVFSRGGSAACRHAGRIVWKTSLADSGGETVPVFIKMNWGRRRIWPRMNDLKSGQVFQTLPEREWHGLARFADLGINVARRLALFRDGLLTFRAAIIIAAVPPPMSIDEMIQTGCWAQLSARSRAALLDEVIATIGRIHSAGLGWRGVSSRHFFPQRQNDGTWKLWLIDCEGVHPRATRKTVERSDRKLWCSMRESGADAATLDALQTRIDQILAGYASRAAS